jgi:WD40 repeat protein
MDAVNGEKLWQVMRHPGDLDANEDGSLLAIGALTEYGVSVLDARTGKVLKELARDRYSPKVWLSPDGRYMLTASTAIKKENSENESVVGHPVEVWSVSSGALLGSLPGHAGGVLDIAFSPDSTRVVTTSLDRSARVWELERRSLIAKLEGHTGAVRSAAFSRDGQRIATASEDATARVWDATTGRLLATLSGYSDWALTVPTVDAVLFDRDGGRLLVAGQALTVWDVGLERRDPQQILGIVGREVPWMLVGGQLTSRNVREE